MDDKTGTRRRGVARPSYAEDEEGNNQNAMDEEEEDDEMEEDFLEEEEEKEEEEDEEMTNYDDSMIAVAVPAVVERSSRPRRVVVAPTKPHHHQPVPRSSLEGPPRNSNSSAKQKSYANFNKPTAATATNAATAVPLRSSSRSNKYTESMTDPTASLRDILSRREELADSDNATDEAATVPRSRATSKPKRHGPTAAKHASSPVKSPARRHAQNRNRLPQQRQQSRKNSQKSSSSSALELSSSSGDEESSDNDDDDEEETGEPLKVQRILASRTESKAKWKLICLSMNTSEIHYGSRWYQTTVDPKDPSSVSASDKNDNNNGNNNDNNNDSLLDEANPLISDHTEGDVLEERFLVKWADLSFLHVSWETLGDLVDQADAKAYLTTFSRKSVQGLLYTPDERCDGDYFDPAFVEIDRILSVQLPSPDDDDEDDNHPRRKQQLQQPRLTAETEDACGPQSFGMIMDKTDPQFDSGTGRQFLVKWGHTSYSESTYEFERDLIINEIEYKEPVKSFLRRNAKPSKQSRRSTLKSGEDEYKRLYNVFGNKSKLMEADREKAVEEYKQTLGNVIYKNGGQLRDYQAEGVAWMISNFVNLRSCILADEMGLGKTLQIAASTDLLANSLKCGGPVLVIAPLSTLTHWYREFSRWTDLNTIVYHGSAADRKLIREHEFVYECDRPETEIAFNQMYLKKCVKKNSTKAESPWMVDVVVTSPEIMIADDAMELTAVPWELLVVDEAHRLKNFKSKLAVGLRNEKFCFRHRILLTGTPIQNDVQEFWTLLNFIDPDGFNSLDDFMNVYGDMKSKERVDQLHEEIRPYILRRLKEDVERSVPPKEETLIEVELTISQKQYYRALYEKNLVFLNKNKKKALEGPSLSNLAMQLRKCCNHLFLLNGVEIEFRKAQEAGISEADFLVRGSGKLVLLDKLLPRLKEEGHRVLLFSQFKIMLDILEDYLNARQMKFERIDGSITGNKRQQAIDRFQAPATPDKEAPFIMMLSTRAGGVGITLTAADTCIIVDSDWNPQNDLQAQARCHRIGQTKSVKVYRLLTRKTYEMQMFHMSSLKMGLDQAVLKGFESKGSGEGGLSKEEVERLLRHGAYDIFNEDKVGESDAKSNDFVQQDIDTILQRHSQTIVHENTGSKSVAVGGTFSKASFKVKAPDSNSKNKGEDIDIEDPDFWKKMIGEAKPIDDDDVDMARRSRTRTNYSDNAYKKEFEASIRLDAGESSSDDSDYDHVKRTPEMKSDEASRAASNHLRYWKKDDVDTLLRLLSTYGYGNMPWADFLELSILTKVYTMDETKRMCWSLVLTTLLECAEEDGKSLLKREYKKQQMDEDDIGMEGGILAVDRSQSVDPAQSSKCLQQAFLKLRCDISSWIDDVLSDALAYALISGVGSPTKSTYDDVSAHARQREVETIFGSTIWPTLKNKGWTAALDTDATGSTTTMYSFQGLEYTTTDSVLKVAFNLYPELQSVVGGLMRSNENDNAVVANRELSRDHVIDNMPNLQRFLKRYGEEQLLSDREKTKRIRLPRKVLTHSTFMRTARNLTARAFDDKTHYDASIDRMAAAFSMDKRVTLPHPMWTSRHDAVLIHAISKHGWIDQDGAARRIADDSTVSWGSPFGHASNGTGVGLTADENLDQILATGIRAAKFLTEHSSMVEDLKDFNSYLVIRAYSLSRKSLWSEHDDDYDGFANHPSRAWEVNRGNLQGVPGLPRHMGAGALVDLPPKKDLVKRARSILTKGSPTPSPLQNQDQTTEYSVLDQKDRANIFLAEMIRALMKEPSTSKHFKALCNLASAEAHHRATVSMKMSSELTIDRRKAALDQQRIAEHIHDFRRNFSTGATQYKNVLRVILGEEAHKMRNNGENMFPVKRTTLSLKTTAIEGHHLRAPKVSSRPLGEKAITQARQRLVQKNSGSPTGSHPQELELTEIETQILSCACTIGIPIWKDDWRSTFQCEMSSSQSSSISWPTFGKFMSHEANKSLQRALEKVKQERASLYTVSVAWPSNALESANRSSATKESAATQAKDYADEPEILAKKSLMLLEKIRKHVNAMESSTLSVLSDSSVGAKVVMWLGKEISRWASSLDLLGDDGCPLAFTAVEFLDELPEAERRSIEISSLFDEKSSSHVIAQVALMTRLRSLNTAYDRIRFSAEAAKAAVVSDSTADRWDQQPLAWNPSCDLVLLRRLLVNGFTDNLLSDSLSHGGQSKSIIAFSRYPLSKGALQLRANKLVRVLHASEEVLKCRQLDGHQNAHESCAVQEKPTIQSLAHQDGQNRGQTRFYGDDDDDDDDVIEVLSPTSAQRSVAAASKRKDNGNDGTASSEKKYRSL